MSGPVMGPYRGLIGDFNKPQVVGVSVHDVAVRVLDHVASRDRSLVRQHPRHLRMPDHLSLSFDGEGEMAFAVFAPEMMNGLPSITIPDNHFAHECHTGLDEGE